MSDQSYVRSYFSLSIYICTVYSFSLAINAACDKGIKNALGIVGDIKPFFSDPKDKMFLKDEFSKITKN